MSRTRVYLALGSAVLFSLVIFYFGTPMMEVHNRIAVSILEYTHIPVSGIQSVDVFPHLGPVAAPNVPFPQAQANLYRTGMIFSICFCALLLIHRSFALSRNFVVFLVILLCAAEAVIVFNPAFYFNSKMYVQVWLRGEILVWLLLPWVSAFLFVLSLPSAASGVAWALLLQIYAVAWSAVRLAFSLGVLHYTGILFLPLLWFSLGVLFDLVYVLVFYSMALRISIRQTGGGRES